MAKFRLCDLPIAKHSFDNQIQFRLGSLFQIGARDRRGSQLVPPRFLVRHAVLPMGGAIVLQSSGYELSGEQQLANNPQSEHISNHSSSEFGLDPETLWEAADKLRGSIDAAEYKHVVLGLIFLKYISDAFETRRHKLAQELEADGIKGEEANRLLESRDEYTAENIFWVPLEARWGNVQNQAKQPNIARLIDDAMHAIERDNPKLKGKLPHDYARRGIAPERLGGLIDKIASIAIGTDQARAKDVL